MALVRQTSDAVKAQLSGRGSLTFRISQSNGESYVEENHATNPHPELQPGLGPAEASVSSPQVSSGFLFIGFRGFWMVTEEALAISFERDLHPASYGFPRALEKKIESFAENFW